MDTEQMTIIPSPPWRDSDGAPAVERPPLMAQELPPVAGMWHEAVDRGWTITVDGTGASWRVTSPDKSAGIAFTAPEDLGGAGSVSAFDTRRTMALTGVRDAAEAAALVRAFLGWRPGPWPASTAGGPVDCHPAAGGVR